MKSRRRVWWYLAGAVVVLLLALATLPWMFRGRIEDRLKAALSGNLNAEVDWRRLHLSILRDFPNLSLGLDDLAVTGVGHFDGDTLLAVPEFRLVLDLGSVLGSLRSDAPVLIRSVALEGPALHLLALPDGTANWDILKPAVEQPADPASDFRISLEGLELARGLITLDNRQTGLRARLAGLHHTMSGDFGQERFTLETETVADSASLSFTGVPWLRSARLAITADVAADLEAGRFTLQENEVRLNELRLQSAGSVALAEDSVALDLTFEAPETDFRELLSLVPAIYAESFETLQTSGSMAVRGWVRGGWGESAFPALALNADVRDASFRYPDLPLPARDISLALSLSNPGGSLDSTVVRLERGHVVLGNDPIDGSFEVRTPVSDPDAAFRVSGRLDLANLGRTVKLPNETQLAGTVVANASMRARLSDVEQRRYERVSADGTVTMSGLSLSGEELRQPVRIEEAVLRFTPQRAELSAFRGRFGTSAVTMTGSLDNLLGYVLRDQELRGAATLASPRFDLNEWRSDDELEAIPVPANLDFTIQAAADTVTFGTLALQNAAGVLQVRNRRVTLEDFRMNLFGGDMTVTGFYETLDPVRPVFDIAARVTDFDVPAAFAGIRTVQAFAPVARYAEGSVSADLRVNGALGTDMMPVFEVLSGLGSLATSGLVLRDFPALDRLAATLNVPQLNDPGFMDLASSFEIRDGRLIVKPFDVRFDQFAMNVAGSNGIDQSLDYTLALQLPRAALGTEASRAVSRIVAQSARAGLNLEAAETITLGARVTGTITDPQLAISFREATGSVAETVEQAVRERVDSGRAEVAARVDSAALRLIAEAEERAAAIRAEAQQLAERIRAEAAVRADSLEARPTNPIARAAAKAAADRLRQEADARANALVREADTRAEAVLAEARRRGGVQPPQ